MDQRYNDGIFQGPNGGSPQISTSFCASLILGGVSGCLIGFGYIVWEVVTPCDIELANAVGDGEQELEGGGGGDGGEEHSSLGLRGCMHWE